MSITLRPEEITRLLKQQLTGLDYVAREYEAGTVVSVGDGIARVYGLDQVMAGELVEFANGRQGLVLNLEEDSVGVVILGEDLGVSEGAEVRRTGKVASVPVGEGLLGRVVDALGQPLDGGPPIAATEFRPVDIKAPGITERRNVCEPLQTGIKAIDALTPIGRGQRELIIGDRKTGKTTLAIDAIINQRQESVYCFYVAIGQKRSTVVEVHETLRKHGAMKYTTIIAATASDPAPMQFLAPYAGCAMAEYYRDRGCHALIVYDDLTKQAQAYRQLSLLLRRPPGREAFPGDIFYLHSRLLERAAKLSEANGNGSLTALPIVETQANDIAAYIPTNVISITDGQIFLEPDLFYAGQRPAMNPGISVSRVGGDAQVRPMKQVAGSLRLELAQYRDLVGFAQFAADLDAETRRQLDRGVRLMQVMRQGVHQPVSVVHQVAIIRAGIEGLLDVLDEDEVPPFEEFLDRALDSHYADWGRRLEREGSLTDEAQTQLDDILRNTLKAWRDEHPRPAAK